MKNYLQGVEERFEKDISIWMINYYASQTGGYFPKDLKKKFLTFIKSEISSALAKQREEMVEAITNDIREFRRHNPGWSKLNAWWIEAKRRILSEEDK